MAADDFKKLLDEQKKSNELLTSIDNDIKAQGTAKEIVKAALPEIANDRRLQQQRNKFDKKEGKTEIDEKVTDNTKAVKELIKSNKKDNKELEERTSTQTKTIEKSSKQEKILKKSKKFNTALKDLNMTVSELEDELNVRFKELDPKHKKVTLTKYKVGDFTK